MKTLLFLFLVPFLSFAKSADSNQIVGNSLGYCDPIGDTPEGSRLCSYKFKNDKSAEYSCEFYSDLRCTSKIKKNISILLSYEIIENEKIKISYPKNDEHEYELDRIVIKGDLLKQIGLEMKKRSEKEPHKDFIGPFYFTREKIK